MIKTIAASIAAIQMVGGDGPSGPVDHSHDFLYFGITLGIVVVFCFLCWLGYRYDKSKEWNDEGGN